MLYLYGTNLSDFKKVRYALTSINGLGYYNSNKICNLLALGDQYKVHQLTDNQISKICQLIEHNFVIQGDLRKEIYLNINRLVRINCYKGVRHSQCLPVRGQRTHTNAKTQKRLGKRYIKN